MAVSDLEQKPPIHLLSRQIFNNQKDKFEILPECLEKNMQNNWIYSSMQLFAEFLTKNLLP